MLCALKSGLQRKKTPPSPTAGLFVFDWGHMRTERGIQNPAGQSSSRTDSFLLCPARREEWTPADRFPSAPAVKTCARLGGILPSSTAERSCHLPEISLRPSPERHLSFSIFFRPSRVLTVSSSNPSFSSPLSLSLEKGKGGPTDCPLSLNVLCAFSLAIWIPAPWKPRERTCWKPSPHSGSP